MTNGSCLTLALTLVMLRDRVWSGRQQYPIFKNVTFADFEVRTVSTLTVVLNRAGSDPRCVAIGLQKFATSVAINTQSLTQKQLQGIYRQVSREWM